MVFYPLQREVSLEDTKVNQLPPLFMSTLLHNLNYSIEIESPKAAATLRRLIKKESRCGTWGKQSPQGQETFIFLIQ